MCPAKLLPGPEADQEDQDLGEEDGVGERNNGEDENGTIEAGGSHEAVDIANIEDLLGDSDEDLF